MSRMRSTLQLATDDSRFHRGPCAAYYDVEAYVMRCRTKRRSAPLVC